MGGLKKHFAISVQCKCSRQIVAHLLLECQKWRDCDERASSRPDSDGDGSVLEMRMSTNIVANQQRGEYEGEEERGTFCSSLYLISGKFIC
jgi:hypothetical protein